MVVAMSAQLLGAFFLVPGVFSEQFLACKGALDVSSHDLDGGVRSAAVTRTRTNTTPYGTEASAAG